MVAIAERGLWLPAAERADLRTFAAHARRLDEAAVLRLQVRSEDTFVVWAATGFDVLACRVVGGRLRPDDLSVGADALVEALSATDRTGFVDPGYPMDSAWRSGLPPRTGFVHLDDIPARVVLDLAQRGAALAREQGGAKGPPVSLLDQEVLSVSAGERSVAIPMRCVFALTAMGFVPNGTDAAGGSPPGSVPDDEVVRVRAAPAWLRIDARYGSLYRRRGAGAVMLR